MQVRSRPSAWRPIRPEAPSGPVTCTRAAITIALAALLTGPAWGQSSLPDPSRTPGALNPEVTQETIDRTICMPGWTDGVRPPREYTSAVKRAQLREWRYADRRLSHYEEDHLVPLGLGGALYDARNLWPEPRYSADGWDADRKDELEYVLNHLVCARRLSLRAAQQAIATDWIAAYRRFVAPAP